jgi:hypothetical protein
MRLAKDLGSWTVWTDWFVFVPLTVLMLWFLMGPEMKTNGPIPSILARNDTLHFSSGETSVHNRDLMTALLQHQANAATIQIAREDTRMQARLFFAAILAALASASVLLLPTEPNHEGRNAIAIAVILLSCLMYFLDVHMLDLNSRITRIQLTSTVALEQLLRTSPHDSSWQDIDNSVPLAEMNSAAESTNRRLRKAYFAARPDLEQLAYYFFPMLVIYSLTSWPQRIQKRRRIATGFQFARESRGKKSRD